MRGKNNRKNFKKCVRIIKFHVAPCCLILFYPRKPRFFFSLMGWFEYKHVGQGRCSVACLLSHFRHQDGMRGDAIMVKDTHSTGVESEEVWRKCFQSRKLFAQGKVEVGAATC